MELTFKIGSPADFDEAEKSKFLSLLQKQGQNDHPGEYALEACPYLCMVHSDGETIGIGAIKELYRLGFDYAGAKKLKHDFEAELGYLFVDDGAKDGNFRNLGIGKTITRLLLKTVGNENIFATTEFDSANPMLHILKSLGFKKSGKTYVGSATGKKLGLMLRFKEA